MAAEVRHNETASRYELHLDGTLIGVADYHRDGGVIVIPHAEIEASRRGQGLGAELVRGTLDEIRGTGSKVVPRCWYVRQYIDEHPEYADLVA